MRSILLAWDAMSFGSPTAPIALRVVSALAAGLFGVTTGVLTFLVGFAFSMAEAPWWLVTVFLVAVGLACGFVGLVAIAGAAIGALLMTIGGFGGAFGLLVMLALGGMAGLPLGIASRRRLERRLEQSVLQASARGEPGGSER